MTSKLRELYQMMFRSRQYEQAIANLWRQGFVSGELHDGTGEEAIIAGIISQLIPGDALALDHRGTAAIIMAGVDPTLLIKELLGLPDGLCGGYGGHMHLFSKEPLAASSGIVGASGPTAVGFALSAQQLGKESIAVAFFGEGAVNQGMLMESMNLAVVWKLPVVFVCKDDQRSISTTSALMTGGSIRKRAEGIGLSVFTADSTSVMDVWKVATHAIEFTRRGQGPCFIHASCIHLEGHFQGYQLFRAIRYPMRELPAILLPLVKTFCYKGESLRHRLAGLNIIATSLLNTVSDLRRNPRYDPLLIARTALDLDDETILHMENEINSEVDAVVEIVMKESVQCG
ncbi:MAG: thiamine pyrophosphate-dependent dehydrogenase E1 component subunit alpha [Anaerolineae bacterium]|nr:thiamine pyrophosphate-dependent dehydrogenase E1 component subunit alpha [Anaerolineae bacterium]